MLMGPDDATEVPHAPTLNRPSLLQPHNDCDVQRWHECRTAWSDRDENSILGQLAKNGVSEHHSTGMAPCMEGLVHVSTNSSRGSGELIPRCNWPNNLVFRLSAEHDSAWLLLFALLVTSLYMTIRLLALACGRVYAMLLSLFLTCLSQLF